MSDSHRGRIERSDVPDPFAMPKARLGRAKQGHRTLVTQRKAFFNKEPYAKFVEKERDTAREFQNLKLTRRMPNRWSTIAMETIEHARAVLDQAGYVTASLSGKPDTKRAYFPIADSLGELETSVIGRGRCKTSRLKSRRSSNRSTHIRVGMTQSGTQQAL